MTQPPSRTRTLLLTAGAMAAFAANSILCREALRGGSIDPASFTSVRLVSGALVLLLVTRVVMSRPAARARGSWLSAGLLFAYAVAFSFAYLELSAGTGALILFGAVQVTMILAGLRSGERPPLLEWTGLFLAFAGLVYLVLPGLSAPDPLASALMALAGVAWGGYSLRGRAAKNPFAETSANFLRSVPLVLVVSAAAIQSAHLSTTGVLLAAASGALASGLGYVIWYAALAGLPAMRAATVQLSVPVLAAAGGILLLSETLTTRLAVSGVVILGGIALALATREPAGEQARSG